MVAQVPTLSGDELSAVLREYVDVAERLRHTHEKLESEVVRLREELASKDQELERRRRLAALGELAAGVAHEVRNPLGAIQLYSGLLRRECTTLAPALELINKIESGIQAIERVVQDTLALTPRPARLTCRALSEILADAAEFCAPALRKANADLHCTVPEPAPLMHGDTEGLARVFMNLIANAAEASPPGGIIELSVRSLSDERVAVRVRDQGPGLSDEVLDRIFDPFFTTKATGTGLGLTIAHRLTEAHGGALTARNRPDGGAEFVVELPTSAAADARDAPAGAVRPKRAVS